VQSSESCKDRHPEVIDLLNNANKHLLAAEPRYEHILRVINILESNKVNLDRQAQYLSERASSESYFIILDREREAVMAPAFKAASSNTRSIYV
jgi:hypothetical protein